MRRLFGGRKDLGGVKHASHGSSKRLVAALSAVTAGLLMAIMVPAVALGVDAEHVVNGVTPRGTTIDLFDYWATDGGAGDDGHNPDQGINQGRQLKFNEGAPAFADDLINSWVGKGNGPRTGMVERGLTDGYPSLANTLLEGWSNYDGGTDNQRQQLNKESLAYLFDESEQEGKQGYFDVGGLLQVDSDGYYYYNAAQDQTKDAGRAFETANFASFDPDTSSFTLYDSWGVHKEGEFSSNGQFFPFAPVDAVLNGNGSPKLIKSTEDRLNHYFGMHMSTRFMQQYGGHVDEDGTKPVTYEFSGDDDVWIYIDDVLVADLGGIHDAASVKIDFSTGKITVTAADGSDVTPEGMKTIKECFASAGSDTSIGFRDNTFANNTYHTLDFFYLERGNNDSNMSLKYNLVTIPESGVWKIDQDGKEMDGVSFSLFPTGEDYAVDEGAAAYYSGTTVDGELVFTTTEGSATGEPIPVSLEQLNNKSQYWVLREQSVSGYRNPGDIHLRFQDANGGKNSFLLSSNPWETGAYAQPQVTVQASDTLYGIIDGTTKGNEIAQTEDGFIFAVVLQRQGAADNWAPVSGDAFHGWNIVGKGLTVDNVIKAAKQNLYRFYPGSGGALETTIDNLPGDIMKYAYVKNGSSSSVEGAEYTIAYYYCDVASLDVADDADIHRLYVDGERQEGFERQFSVTLNISNIKNELTLKKVDQDGNPMEGVEFKLYKAGDDFQKDGEAIQTLKTDDEGCVKVVSDRTEGLIANGRYVLEEVAPQGYIDESTSIQVVVNDDGVFVNAGAEGDNVSVETGIGSLVYSMQGFAAADDVDATLHDVKAQPQKGEYSGVFTWEEVEGENEIHYHYNEDGTNKLDYVKSEIGASGTYHADAGWSRLAVTQCLNADEHGGLASTEDKTDLGNQDLTNLFTMSTTVIVENTKSGPVDLKAQGGIEVTKIMTGRAIGDGNFSFTIEATASGNTTTDESQAKLGMTDALQTYEFDTAELQGGKASSTVDVLDGVADYVAAFNQSDIGKTYTYKISEVTPSADEDDDQSVPGIQKDGVTYDASAYTLTFTTESAPQNGGIKVTATLTEEGGQFARTITYTSDDAGDADSPVQIAFSNHYGINDLKRVDTATSFNIKKQLQGAEWDDGQEFKFVIEANDGAPTPTIAEPVVSKPDEGEYNTATVNFGTIDFTKPGVYTYTVREEHAGETIDGITYDSHELTVYVTVGDDGNGKLSEPKVTFGGNTTFVNVCEASLDYVAKGGLTIVKNLKGADITDGGFAFIVTPKDQISAGKIGLNDWTEGGSKSYSTEAVTATESNGTLIAVDEIPVLDALVFTAAEDGATYSYSVREQIPDGAVNNVLNDVVYDDTVYDVTISVAFDRELVVTTTVTPQGGTGTSFVYREGSDDADPATVPFQNTYKTSTEPGEPDNPEEPDNPPVNPPKDPDPVGPSTPDVDIDKTLTGRDMIGGEFSFVIKTAEDYGTDVSPTSLTGTSDADGNVTFNGGFTFKKADTYKFMVSEMLPADDDPDTEGVQHNGVTYDQRTHTVIARVTEVSGKLQLKWEVEGGGDSLAFENSYEPSGTAKISFGAKKVLNGRDLAAGEFTFVLKNREGEIVQTVTNAADGSIVFDAIEFTEPGTYTYYISEVTGNDVQVDYDDAVVTAVVTVVDNGDGTLTATVSYDGANEQPTFVNTYNDPGDPEEPGDPGNPGDPDEPREDTPSIPQTGDNSALAVVATAAAGVILIAGGVMLRRKSRR